METIVVIVCVSSVAIGALVTIFGISFALYEDFTTRKSFIRLYGFKPPFFTKFYPQIFKKMGERRMQYLQVLVDAAQEDALKVLASECDDEKVRQVMDIFQMQYSAAAYGFAEHVKIPKDAD